MSVFAQRTRGKHALLFAGPLVVLAVYVLFEAKVLCARMNRRPPPHVQAEECFPWRRVSLKKPCAHCVHFVTVASLAGRWSSARLAQALRVTAGALRASQPCFTLHAYTDAAPLSAARRQLADAGGTSVNIRSLPEDLPLNAYSGRYTWLELSRRKLDLLELDQRRYGRRAIWTDIDTIIAADLSCAYARAPSFVVSRKTPSRLLWGPRGDLVRIRRSTSAFGDLFMLDEKLIALVRDLERRGMPPPLYDLQDYFSYLLTLCDGSVIDLRSILREDGFMKGRSTCIAFDFSQGHYPTPDVTRLSITNGSLHCGVKMAGGFENHKVATMSFTAHKLWGMLDAPEGFFRTPDLKKWATDVGITFNKRHS